MMTTNSRRFSIDPSLTNLTRRPPFLQRRLAASDRSQKDLQDMIKSLQSGQESMALGSQPSRKAGKNSSMSEEALILVQQDLQGFKADYDSAMVFLKSDLDQLLSRINALESTRRDMSSYAPMVELRELENHLMARWTLQEDVVQNIQKQLHNCIGDLERLNNTKGGAASEGMVATIQSQVQTHLDQVYNNLMSQLESRWATLEALQQSHDMSRANDEAIMQSLKDTDKKFSDNLNIKEQVMIKVGSSRQLVCPKASKSKSFSVLPFAARPSDRLYPKLLEGQL